MSILNSKNKIIVILISIILLAGANQVYARTVDFSGYNWEVKETVSGTTFGPGGNNWGSTVENDPNDVRVDNDGKLHLFVSQRPNEEWYSSEVILDHALGYGKYTFDIETPVSSIDPNLVAAPFIYKDDQHELDIEFSYWQNPSGPNLYYTVQPLEPGQYDETNQLKQTISQDSSFSRNIIEWEPKSVTFTMVDENGSAIGSGWKKYELGDGTINFQDDSERPHINFWQHDGSQPTNTSTAHEFIVKNFNFEKYIPPVDEVTTTSHLILRYNDQIIVDKDILLTTTTYHDTINNIDYPLNGTSTVFSLLVNSDQQNDNFDISDAQFSPWYSSFYVKCLNLVTATSSDNKCDNWQYVVNGNYSDVGMDKTELTGNENVYIYFGDRYSLSVEKNSYTTNEAVVSTLKEYDYQTNEWVLTNNQTILATEPILPDYSNYPPQQFASATTTNGLATFQFFTTGTFFITLPDSYWPGVTISVTSSSTTSTDDHTNDNDGNGNNGGGNNDGGTTHNKLDINKALNFLSEKQNENGSFGSSDLYTDWTALALSTQSNSIAKNKVKQYLLSDPDYKVGLNDVSDLARRAMALMSLGINPYQDTKTNYIQKIVDSFDGTQMGDKDLYNDDIFALFPLLKAGYQTSDPMIVSEVNFILSKQKSDGSWDGADLTAAAIQSLNQVNSLDGVTTALNKAKNYLQSIQNNDGGFGGVESTAWVMQSISALNENSDNWIKDNHNPNDFLFSQQKTDGGVLDEATISNSRIWATAYAIPAVLNKSWDKLLNNFTKPTTQPNNSNPINPDSFTTTTTSTTILLTTSTTFNTSTSTENTTTTITVSIIDNLPEIKKLTTTTSKININRYSPPKEKSKEVSELNSGSSISDNKNITNNLIDELPLDTPTKKTAKKVLTISGGSALAVGLYIGFRLLKNVV